MWSSIPYQNTWALHNHWVVLIWTLNATNSKFLVVDDTVNAKHACAKKSNCIIYWVALRLWKTMLSRFLSICLSRSFNAWRLKACSTTKMRHSKDFQRTVVGKICGLVAPTWLLKPESVLKKLLNLLDSSLVCSLSSTTTYMTFISFLEKWPPHSYLIWAVWSIFLQVSTSPSLGQVYGLRLIVSKQKFRFLFLELRMS